MSKYNRIIYWVATLWLALGMISTGIVQLIKTKEEVDKISLGLGYPVYFLTIIGVWKLLGTVAVLLPKLPLLKEWAYAGFFLHHVGCYHIPFNCGGRYKRIVWTGIASGADGAVMVF